MGKLYIADMAPEEEVEAVFLVRKCSRFLSKKDDPYLKLDLGDRSGHVDAMVWNNVDKLAPLLAEGQIARVFGYTKIYNGSLQITVHDAAAPGDFDLGDIFPAAPRPMEEMKAELLALVETIADPDFRDLTAAALAHPDVADKFWLLPAAKSFHQAYLHGLLEHTLAVARLAQAVAANYPQLNDSLLLAGAVLHDLGKIWEFHVPPRFGYTTLGRLKGHLVMGAEFIERLGRETPDFPPEKLDALVHLILSHHGQPEFGAPVRPQLLEAMALHHVDNIDAKIAAIDATLADGCDEEGWSGYHRLLESCFRRTPDFPPPSPKTEPNGQGRLF